MLLLLAVLTAGLTLAVAHQQDFAQELGKSLRGFGLASLAIALVCVLAQVGFQSLRFWAVTPAEARLNVIEAAHIFTLGDWVNVFAPARGGEVLKALMLKRTGGGGPIDLSRATGVVLADRIVDAGALLIWCTLTGSLGVVLASASVVKPSAAVVAAVAALIAAPLVVVVARQAWAAKLSDVWRQIRAGLASLKHPARCLMTVSLGLGAWASELAALGVLCAGLGFSTSVARLVLALVLVNLGNAVPLTLAGLGVYEATLAYGLRQAGLSLPSAIAVAAAHHSIELLGLGLCTAALALPTHVFRRSTPTFVAGGHDARQATRTFGAEADLSRSAD